MNPFQQVVQNILVIMDDWRVVFALAAVVLVVRVFWARRLRTLPTSEPSKPAAPRHPAAVWVQGIGVGLVVLAWGVLHLEWWIAVLAGGCAYFLPDSLLTRTPDAPQDTGRRAKRDEGKASEASPVGPPPGKHWSLEMLDVVLIALILVFGIVRPAMLQTFFIPSPSMEPTLMGPYASGRFGADGAMIPSPAWATRRDGWNYTEAPFRHRRNLGGDKLIASKMLYRLRPPARGDIVVFTPPIEAVLGASRTERLSQYDLTGINLYVLREYLVRNPGEFSREEIAALGDLVIRKRLDPTLPRGTVISTEADLIRLLPVPAQEDYIKRVIAAPGDRLRIVAGDGVYVNDEKQQEAYIEPNILASAVSFPRAVADPGPRPSIMDTADAASSAMMDSRRMDFIARLGAWLGPMGDSDSGWLAYQRQYKDRIAPYMQGDTFVVPEGHVFVMGDNRQPTYSYDSRWWGCVPISSVKARAVATFWPLDRLKLL